MAAVAMVLRRTTTADTKKAKNAGQYLSRSRSLLRTSAEIRKMEARTASLKRPRRTSLWNRTTAIVDAAHNMKRTNRPGRLVPLTLSASFEKVECKDVVAYT